MPKYSDETIVAVYNFFEHGGPIPDGVILKSSFTETTGCFVTSDEHGTRVERS